MTTLADGVSERVSTSEGVLVDFPLKELHDATTAGYLETLTSARSRFYWTGHRQDVKDWCRQCDVCHFGKSPATHPRAQLQMFVAKYPLQWTFLDPFPKQVVKTSTLDPCGQRLLY